MLYRNWWSHSVLTARALVLGIFVAACSDTTAPRPAATLRSDIDAPSRSESATSTAAMSPFAVAQLANGATCLSADGGTSASVTTVDKCSTAARATQGWTMPAVDVAGMITLPSGLCMDAWGASGAVGSRVGTYTCSPGAPNQQWTLTLAGELRGQNGYCVTVGTEATPSITLQICKGTAAQKWSNLNPTPVAAPEPGTLTNATRCLAATSASSSASITTVTTCDAGAAAQAWATSPVGVTGTITLPNGLCLDAWGGTGAVDSKVGTYNCSPGVPNQLWTLTVAGELRGQNGNCVTVGTEATPSVTLQVCKGTASQKWVGASAAAAAGTVMGATATATSMTTSGTQIAFAPTGASVLKGDTATFTARATGKGGLVLAGRTIAWTSSAPSVARVLGDGRVIAVAPGEATITATVDGLIANGRIVVPNLGSSTVALSVVRFDGGSGRTLVTNGIPMKPGMLSSATLGNVHLYVGGAEVPISVQRLVGRHPDGSIRSILVQFDYIIPNAVAIPAVLAIEPTRQTTYLAPRPANDRPDAVALPNSAAYLTSTNLAGRLTPRKLGIGNDDFETEFTTAAEKLWTNFGARRLGTAAYEHILTTYQYWMRTGDPAWFYRANRMMKEYRDFVEHDNGVVAPWMCATEGLVVDYFLTGDPAVRTLIGKMAESMAGQTRDEFNDWYRFGGVRGDDRMRGRAFHAMLDATLVEAPYGTYYTASRMRTAIPDLLSTQRPNGQFGGDDYLGGQKNFMTGILLTAITRYYDEVAQDPRIPPAIKRATEFMWNTQWVATSGAFRYVSVDTLPGDSNAGVPVPALNGVIMPAFTWYYNLTGDPAYRQRCEEMLRGIRSQVSLWPNWPMQFDQANYRMFNYIAVRAAR